MTERDQASDSAGTPQDESPCDERFEAIIHSVSDGVFAVDEEWRITCFNKAAERTTGLKREEALGRRCSDVFRSNICQEACALRYTMETGHPIVNLMVHILNRDDERVPVTVSTALLKDKHGRIIGGVETFRDLDMAKQLLLKVEADQTQDQIITQDPRLLHILEIVPTIAQSVSTVLIEGESGTGKGLLAQAIHRESGRVGRLVTLNCGALPEQLLESELFGYKTGAFTGATRDKPGRVTVAEGGTLFLDEIGDLPQSVQVKVLRLLQERVYEPLGDVRTLSADVRIVAATNRDLAKLVEDGVIRQDLYYRINVIRLEMPPLRERMRDVPLLTEAFLRRLSTTRGKVVDGLSREARWRLMQYDFPGNVRELENILEHAYVLCAGRRIEVADLPEEFLDKVPDGRSNPRSSLSDLEARLIREVLERKGWNRVEAARELGIHKTTLYRRMRRLGIQLPKVDGRSSKNRKSSHSR
jgi:PAS domain S-box-containing protein